MIWVDSAVFRHSKLLRIRLSAENVVIEIWIPAIIAVIWYRIGYFALFMCQIFNARKFVK